MGEVIAKVAALGAHLIDGVDGRNTEHAYSKGKNEFESGAHKDFGSQSPKAKAKRFDFRTDDEALPVRESKKARPTQRQKTARTGLRRCIDHNRKTQAWPEAKRKSFHQGRKPESGTTIIRVAMFLPPE